METKELFDLFFNNSPPPNSSCKYYRKDNFYIRIMYVNTVGYNPYYKFIGFTKYSAYCLTVLEVDGNRIIHRKDLDNKFLSEEDALNYLDEVKGHNYFGIRVVDTVSYNNNMYTLYTSNKEGVNDNEYER